MGEIIDVRRKAYDHSSGRNRDWSLPDPDKVRKCLTVLAEEGGNAKRAAERCRDENVFPTSPQELVTWRDELHPQMWVQVHSDNEKRLEQIAEAKARENAIRASVIANRAMERIDGQIDAADLLDAAKALDSLTKAQSINTDAVLKWSGRPVQGGTAVSASDTIKALEALGVLTPLVDGSIEEANVVSDETGDR